MPRQLRIRYPDAMYHIIGLGYATNTITVNGATAYRKGEYFRQQLAVANGSAAVWTNISVTEANVATNTGNLFVAQTPEAFTYDADGNLLSDGRWNYSWDAENRLVGMAANTTVAPQQALTFQYDWQGRRIQKQVSPTGSSATNSIAFVYDGWNLVAELNTLNAPAAPTLYRSYLWGLDLSGSLQGAGGVGGLLEMNDPTNGVQFVAYDENGNVAGLVSASSGASSAAYEYGPFGEVIRATGPMAEANPFRFSTKYHDDQTDLLYYGYRFYNPNAGRWLSRDPSEEEGGRGLYSHVSNDPVNQVDQLGLWATDVHHQIVDDWLNAADNNNVDYHHYPWHCCSIDVIKAIQDGSDEVDGVGTVGNALHWCEAQSSGLSYQHAMRDGADNQSVARAQSLYEQFMRDQIASAKQTSNVGRKDVTCDAIRVALVILGRAYHAYSDSLSPAHAGFQPWWGPVDGWLHFGGLYGYLKFTRAHEAKETMDKYKAMRGEVVSYVHCEFDEDLAYILAP